MRHQGLNEFAGDSTAEKLECSSCGFKAMTAYEVREHQVTASHVSPSYRWDFHFDLPPRPGWFNPFAMVVIGLSLLVWWKSGEITAWSLSQGIIREGATRTLPEAIRYAAMAVAAIGLIAAYPILIWSASLVYGWMPMKTFIDNLWGVLKPHLGYLQSLVNDILRVIVGGRALLVGSALQGIQAVANATSLTVRYAETLLSTVALITMSGLRYLHRATSTILRYTGIAVSAVIASLILITYALLRYIWSKVTIPIHTLLLGLATIYRYTRSAFSVLLHFLSQLIGYPWMGFTVAVRILGMGVNICVSVAARYLGLSISAAVGIIVRGMSLITRTVRIALHFLPLVVLTLLGYLWIPIPIVFRPIWQGLSTFVRFAGQALRYAGLGISAIFSYLWDWASLVLDKSIVIISAFVRMVSLLLAFLKVGTSSFRGFISVRALNVLRSILLWSIIMADAADLGLHYIVLGNSAILGHLRLGVSTVLGYLIQGLSVFARIVGLALGFSWLGISAVASIIWLAALTLLRPIWLGLTTIVRVLIVVVRYVGLGVYPIIGYLTSGVSAVQGYWMVAMSTVARIARLAFDSIWAGISASSRQTRLALIAVLRPVLLGLITIGQATGFVMRYIWLGVFAIIGYLWLGVSTIIQAIARGLHYMGRGCLMTLRYPILELYSILQYAWVLSGAGLRFLWLGVSTSVLTVAWVVGYIWKIVRIALRGLRRIPIFLMRTAWVGIAASPDTVRMVIWMTRNRRWVHTLSDFNLTRERLLSLIATIWVFGVLTAFMIPIWMPPPPEPTIEITHWTNSHLTRDGLLPDMAELFNAAGHMTKSGKRIVIKVYRTGSGSGARDLLSRVVSGIPQNKSLPDPIIFTPHLPHWLVGVNHAAGRSVVDLESSPSIARSFIGIITFRDMAECLGWPDEEIGYVDIITLADDPRGWAKYECAKSEWGQWPLLSFTDPTSSSTGRGILYTLYAIAAGKSPEQMTLADIKDPAVVDFVKRFNLLIDHYMPTSIHLNTKIYQGPQYGHFFLMAEDNLIHLYEGTEIAYFNGEPVTALPIDREMVMIYPKEGSTESTHCACIINAPWVSEEENEAARVWIDFLREDSQQQTLMNSGFRPATGLSVEDVNSKINGRYGLDPNGPKSVIDPTLTPPEVAAAIAGDWDLVKKPGIVTFVVDTSGSMFGDKLDQAKDGLIRALDSMAKNNQIGFLTFDDDINTSLLPAPLTSENRFKIRDEVMRMRARGETALYDAIKAGIEMTDEASGETDAIRAVVVLTDGIANRGQMGLHDLINMMSAVNEEDIVEVSGSGNDQWAIEEGGGKVKMDKVIGTDLAFETKHPGIKIFFIGVGSDADIQVGRVLAEASNATFIGTTEEDLANVLETFSRFF